MKGTSPLKLPASLQGNNIANHLKKYLQTLGPSSGFYSCLLYGSQGKYYFLLKDNTFPYISFDWSMYTLMRIKAKTIITSGITFRKQKPIYGEDRGTFGKEQLAKIYEQNHHSPFNLIVYTSKMKDQEVKQAICEKYFKFISTKQLGGVEDNFKSIAQRVNQLAIGPTIYENGNSLVKAMQEVKSGQRNFVEMIILSLFQGGMPQKFIGQEYQTKILDRDFDKVWESEKINSTAKHENGQEKPVTLKYIVYIRKDKHKN